MAVVRKWTPAQRKKFMRSLRARQRAKQQGQELPIVELPATDDQKLILAHKLVDILGKLF